MRKQRIKMTREKTKKPTLTSVLQPISYEPAMTKKKPAPKPKLNSGTYVSAKQVEKQLRTQKNPKISEMKKSYNFEPPTLSADILDESHENDSIAASMSSIFSSKLQLSPSYSEDNMQRIGDLMQREIDKGKPSVAKASVMTKSSPSSEIVQQEMSAYHKMFVEQPTPKAYQAPSSKDSMFSLSPQGGMGCFEQAMRTSVNAIRGEALVPPMEKLKSAREEKKRSASAAEREDRDRGGEERESSSSR